MKTWSTPATVSSIGRRSTTRTRELLVLGLGNLLVGDDGLGAAVVARLARQFELSEGVRVVDGGTLGLALLPLLQDCDAAILIDAIRSGDAPPGTLIRLEGDAVARAVRHHLSVHQIGVADLLDAARLTGACPSELVLLGLVPADLELGVGLSSPVDRNVPLLIDAILTEIGRFGVSIHEREALPDPSHHPDLPAPAVRPPESW